MDNLFKKTLQIFQIVGFVVFAILALYVNLAQDNLKDYARGYINQSIEPKVTNSVGLAEEMLASPKVPEYLALHQIEVISAEIATYRDDPLLYIEKITDGEVSGGVSTKVVSDDLNPLVRSLLGKIVTWKESVERYFNETFDEIVFDLTVFSVTNMFAFGIALWLSRSAGIMNLIPYRVVSVILTFSVIYTSMMYLDQNWFFTILLKSYFGVGYPIMIGTVFYSLYLRYKEISTKEVAV